MVLRLCCRVGRFCSSEVEDGLKSENIDSNQSKSKEAFGRQTERTALHPMGALGRQLAQDGRLSASSKEIRILLLGNGQSGKSTFLNQMRILHNHAFESSSECSIFLPIINSNLMESLRTILLTMEEQRLELTSVETLKHKKEFLEFFSHEYRPRLANTPQNIPDHLGKIITGIWRDVQLQESYYKAIDLQVSENAKYFMEHAQRVCCLEYTPTKQDILRSWTHTMGITELSFCLEANVFRMTDIGGQRSQRKKWISMFDHMDSVLFFVALSVYNLLLEEDNQTNRMKEALRVFSDLTLSPFLDYVVVMLFLNKTDLFREKLKRYPLKMCFQEYSGPNNFGPAIDYVASQFKDQCTKENIYTHYTCSTDTTYIQNVFLAVSDVLLKQMIDNIGLN
ncbi:guanine nucleotide-binding protein G(i) subunit alpha-like [Tigriopus californicus]|uniref:guanine nucleotide-binding protein G(i) subunit alpha-like n=1 Tax=Tigriopus californicus TaxID=6832 RepID=UPI0027DA40B7|nr:guanine nucleotide-binding protein G(i) subunit alpha-like [Tigriopus californicus]